MTSLNKVVTIISARTDTEVEYARPENPRRKSGYDPLTAIGITETATVDCLVVGTDSRYRKLVSCAEVSFLRKRWIIVSMTPESVGSVIRLVVSLRRIAA